MKIDQDEYFMKIADVVKLRSGCLKRKVGSVLVKDNHIISTGYNQTPKDILIAKMEDVKDVHQIQNQEKIYKNVYVFIQKSTVF